VKDFSLHLKNIPKRRKEIQEIFAGGMDIPNFNYSM
jgi:hypothetical protein